jgi:hypothetical protein
MRAKLGHILERIGRHRRALAFAGLIGLGLVMLNAMLLSHWPAPRDDPPEAATVFAVLNPRGARIGALDVQYPARLRENQDGAILVRYSADEAWRERFAAASDLRLEVAVHGGRLEVGPAPTAYAFDNRRIAATGADARRWIVSPEAEGDYTLLVRLAAAPAGFAVRRLTANGEIREGAEAALPVAVETRHGLPQVAIDSAQLAVGLISFLLTLPAAAIALRQWRSGAPAPPSAQPAPAAKRPRRGKRG